MFLGIDVSEHNGKIDWKEAKKHISFAIIRAGYGGGNLDKEAIKNIMGCRDNEIPYGLYWFSYALNETGSKYEANCLCDVADKYAPVLPLAFDYEYESDNYFFKKTGKAQSNLKRKSIAKTFLDTVDNRGYSPILYTNIDYLTKGFSELQHLFPIWLAQWREEQPTIKFEFWQKSNKGKIPGINGDVDINVTEKDYVPKNAQANWKKAIQQIDDSVWERYYELALMIIKGKYGIGEERKKAIAEIGMDYKIAQSIVNWLLK